MKALITAVMLTMATVTGCASSDTVSIKRSELALLYADARAEIAVFVDRMQPRCQNPRTPEQATKCAEFRETMGKLRGLDDAVRKLIASEQAGPNDQDIQALIRLGLRVAALAGL